MPIKNEYYKKQPEKKVFSVKYADFVIINRLIIPSAFFMNSSG